MDNRSLTKFSIGIPTHRLDRRLRNTLFVTLNSIDYPRENFEICLFVNGDHNEALPFLPFVDKVEFDKKELGPSAAKNRVIEMATHPWVILLDSDDFLVPSALKVYDSAVQKNPQMDVAFEYSAVNFLKEKFSYPPSPVEFGAYFYTQIGLLPKTGALGHATIIRKDCPFRFDEEVKFAEERDLAVRMLTSGATPHILQSCSYVYNWNESGISSHSETLNDEQRASLEKIRQPLEAKSPESLKFQIVDLPFMTKQDREFVERTFYLEKMNG